MVRVDRDLKRCYFYRIKIEGDVKKTLDIRTPSPEFPKSGIAHQDIIPYNPHIRERTSRITSRPSSNRRISWSRQADRVREISPRSEPDPVKIFYPPPARSSDSFDYSEIKHSPTPKKKKRSKTKLKSKAPVVSVKPQAEPLSSYSDMAPLKSSNKKNQNLIREQRDKRFMAQKREQAQRKKISNSNLRKVKSETNLRDFPKEPLMKKADSGKTKHFNPPRWRHVGDRTRTKHSDKNSRSFASDYYF